MDVHHSDDMLLCLDALRWGHVNLDQLVPDGDLRVEAVIRHWGMEAAHQA